VGRPGVLAEATGLAHRLAALPRPAVREVRRLLNLPFDQAASRLAEASLAEFGLFDTPEHHQRAEELSQRLAGRSRDREG
jgi:hypothetical protein